MRDRAREGEREAAELLNRVCAFLAAYLVLPGLAYLHAMALWIVHAHAIEAADTSPRLLFKSPEKQSGKTRALELVELVVPKPLLTVNASVAAVFRLLKEEQATILFDEVDAIFGPHAGEHEDLRALLNAGYRKGATVARVVGEGKRMRVERFPVFAATALAAKIDHLPDTIEDRSIIVPMRRRAPDEHVERLRRRLVKTEAEELSQWLEQWAGARLEELKVSEPTIPDELPDRAAECWEPLLAIAEMAGPEWTKRAREAATLIASGLVVEDQSRGVRFLRDIREVTVDRISSAELCKRLNALEESPWGGWNDGKGITPRDLAKLLKPYGIRPKDIRLPDGTHPKGYERGDFADAWSRYLPSAEERDSRDKRDTNSTPVADVALVAPPSGGEGASANGAADICPKGGPHAVQAALPGIRPRCLKCLQEL